jgi:hypothetical protein
VFWQPDKSGIMCRSGPIFDAVYSYTLHDLVLTVIDLNSSNLTGGGTRYATSRDRTVLDSYRNLLTLFKHL